MAGDSRRYQQTACVECVFVESLWSTSLTVCACRAKTQCGVLTLLLLYRAEKHLLHCFGWKSVESVLTEAPQHEQFDVVSSSRGTNGQRMDIGTAGIGTIAAIARVSPAICILATGTQLVLEDISCAAPALNSMLRSTISVETPPISNLLLRSETPSRPTVREQPANSPSDIIDLTSIRVTSSSTQNSLQILKVRMSETTSSTVSLQ